jgi:extracellular matrix protein 14
MTPSLRHLLLLVAALPLSNAIPATDSPSSYLAPLSEQSSTHLSSIFSNPFRALRNAIIERIWDVPAKSKPKPCSSSQSSVPSNYRTRYGDDVVLRFKFKTDDEVRALSEAVDILYLDVWEVAEEWVDIRIAKDVVPSLLGLLPASLQTAHAPIMHDLAQAVYDTYPENAESKPRTFWHGSSPFQEQEEPTNVHRDIFFENYQPLSVLYPWLRLMASMFPSHVSLTSIGLSAEGRDIPALRVGARVEFPPGHEHDKRPTLLITGGSHAREWISVSSAAYIAYSLVTTYGDPRYPEVTKLLEHFDVTFLPVLNPDGYEYTFSTDRLWRKTRQQTPLPFCPGIDMDRAFTFGWDGVDTADNPCSEEFAGTQPLESQEAKRLNEWARNQTENNNVTFVAYLDLHSYSQEILYPYSYTCLVDPPNLEDLEEVALGLAKAFRLTHGHYYGVNSACEGSITLGHDGNEKDMVRRSRLARSQMESQGGSALDFFYHDMNVKYAYQIKLRDTGTYGFLLPKEHIVPTGTEVFEAVLGLGRWLLGNHGIEKYDSPDAAWSGSRAIVPEAEEEKAVDDVLADIEDDEYDLELRRRRR